MMKPQIHQIKISMKRTIPRRFIIIGAGPTGLGAASRLQELGAHWILFEKKPYLGGLATSFKKDGFIWDMGSHVHYSHYKKYDDFLNKIIPDNEWVNHQRICFIRLCHQWIPYPLQYNIGFLPQEERWQCIRELIRLFTQKVIPDRSNFQQFIKTHFGEGIATLFMIPYNLKIWAYPLHQMNTNWLGDRVPLIDLEKVLYQVIHNRSDSTWGPNHSFRFPLRGGTGEIWQRLAMSLPQDQIYLNTEVMEIHSSDQTVTLGDGQTISYDILINTMPLDLLVQKIDLPGLFAYAGKLHHNRVTIIGLGIRLPIPELIKHHSWMYFPENDPPFYRATVFSNYSPHNAREDCWSLMLEISDSQNKPINPKELVKQCIDGCLATGLIVKEEDIVNLWQCRAEYSYPIPNHERDNTLHVLLHALESKQIFSRGRFGAWKYEVGNMDHSYMQGVEVVDKILLGSEEITLWNPDRVNSPNPPVTL